MADYPLAQSAVLTAIAVMYRNAALVADMVLPRVPVALPSFEYTTFGIETQFTVPDTRVGRLGRPTQFVPQSGKSAGVTVPYGLEVPVPRRDQRVAAAMSGAFPQAPMQNPLDLAAMIATNLVALDREIRVANIVFALATYLSTQRATLSGTSQWSDFTNSNPIDAILSAMDSMIARPNVGVIGQQAWTKLSQHPRVVGAVLGNAGTNGVVTTEALAGVLGLEKIVIGQGWVNNARPGQTMVPARVWGKHMALLQLDPLGGPDGMPSFGWTAQFGTKVAWTGFDANIGLEGGDNVRVGEELLEVVAAPAAGYFFQNCVA